jgi:hypothetical protein
MVLLDEAHEGGFIAGAQGGQQLPFIGRHG